MKFNLTTAIVSKAVESKKTFLLFVYIIAFTCPNPTEAQALFRDQCPEKCECDLDIRGRMEVSCTQGRMTDIPTIKMNPSSEVIRIVPPEPQPNHLTLGRFFKQFKRLEELHIVNSNIPNIGEHSFWGVQSLRKLNLAQNNITLIIDANFKGLVSLEELNLSHNKIDSFVSASFSALVKLRILDLSWNRATKLVERLFYNLHMLEVLDISGNWLRELTPDVFRDIWRLKELRCRSCGLKTINPLLYARLTGLRILDLGNNEFKYLNREEFGSLIHLRELFLDGNQLSAIIDDTFRSQNFYRLTLASNRIVMIDRNAFQNTTIGSLDISGNKLESLDPQIFNDRIRRNLTHLDLSRNPKLTLNQISIVLSVNNQMRVVHLAENKWDKIPLTLFDKQGVLEVLNISGNHLSDISTHVLIPLKKIRVLDLSANRLKGIDGEFLAYVNQLNRFEDLRLHGNPFACDLCNIPSLLKWIQFHPTFTNGCNDSYGPYCLRCASPPAFYDRAMITIEEPMLDWCNTAESASILAGDAKFGLFIGCGLVILVLVIASVAIVLHSRWHAAHYYTHEDERPEIGTPPLPPDYDLRGDSFDNLYYEKNGNKTTKMIATIEDIPYEIHPHQQTAPNGHHLRAFPPQLTSFKVNPPLAPLSHTTRPTATFEPTPVDKR